MIELQDALAANAQTACEVLMEETPDYAVLMVNDLGLIAYWSSGAANLLGYVSEEILGKGAWILYDRPDHLRAGAEQDMLLARSGGRHETLRLHARKSGSTFLGRSIWRSANEGYVLVIQDTTERRSAEDRFNAIIEGMPEALLIVDADLNILAMNVAAEQITGIERRQVVGRNMLEVTPNLPEAPAFPFMMQALKDKRRIVFDGLSQTLGVELEATFLPLGDGLAVFARRKDG